MGTLYYRYIWFIVRYQVTDFGRVRQNTAIHSKFRLVYSKLGKIAYVHALIVETVEAETTNATSFIQLVCLVNVCKQI